jgi:ferredoxin--NADP+ reductase
MEQRRMLLNDSTSGTLRVAIVGAGPAGFYAADQLLRTEELDLEVDMFDQLPTPYGLVRAGVAPDHENIKAVTRKYDVVARDPRFRFLGNVALGSDLSVNELRDHYNQIIYCVGAQVDRRLGIPGEDLVGSHSATEFVAWYNAHPDYRDCVFDLSHKGVVIIGVGNVAVDVARILCRTPEELATTDIADYALEQLAGSAIEDVYMLGRRGPAQAAFSNPEAKELGELADADVVVDQRDVELDPVTKQWLAENPDRLTDRKLAMIEGFSKSTGSAKRKRLHLRFLVSPAEILGERAVTGVRVVRNRIVRDGDDLRAVPTDEIDTIPCGLVFRSVGYRGLQLAGIPFDDRKGIVRNDGGRVVDDSGVRVGEYVAGWIKRGPTGVIGTNKADAQDTVKRMIEDARLGKCIRAPKSDREAIVELLHQRVPRLFTWADWQRLDELETGRGTPTGRPRVKFTTRQEMIDAVRNSHDEG